MGEASKLHTERPGTRKMNCDNIVFQHPVRLVCSLSPFLTISDADLFRPSYWNLEVESCKIMLHVSVHSAILGHLFFGYKLPHCISWVKSYCNPSHHSFIKPFWVFQCDVILAVITCLIDICSPTVVVEWMSLVILENTGITGDNKRVYRLYCAFHLNTFQSTWLVPWVLQTLWEYCTTLPSSLNHRLSWRLWIADVLSHCTPISSPVTGK
jgi:hypothetical protein